MVENDTRIDFSNQISRLQPGLHRQAYLLCGDWHEAEDLVQETALKLYRHWHRLRGTDDLGAYARTVLARTFVDARRALRWRRETITDLLPDVATHLNGTTEARVMLAPALRMLPRNQQAVIILRFWGGLTVKETSDLLQLPTGTITSNTYRALKTLRHCIDRFQPRMAQPRAPHRNDLQVRQGADQPHHRVPAHADRHHLGEPGPGPAMPANASATCSRSRRSCTVERP